MDVILSLMVSNIATDILPHLPIIQSEITNYFGGISNAALISNDLSAWRIVDFHTPLFIRSPDSNQTQDAFISGIILDNRNDDDNFYNFNVLTRLKLNSDTKLAVVVSKNKNDVTVAEQLEGFKLCHVLVISVTVTGIKSYTFSDIKRHCNVSFMNVPPNVFFTEQKLAGSEGLMFQTVAEHEGISLVYVNRHETEWGDFEPPSGLLGDVGTGSSIAGFGALYPFSKRYKYTDMVFGCEVARFTWAVPSHAGRELPKWLLILTSELSLAVWLLTLLLYIILIPISRLSVRNRNLVYCAFHILALFLCVPQQFLLKRRLALFVLFFGFMFVAHYQTMMCSELTAPAETPEIWTLQDLAESRLRLLGPPKLAALVKDVANTSGKLADLTISERYEATTLDQSDILPNIALQRDRAYLRHDAGIIYSSSQVS